jgi:release factor glutamine methyltransferase
LDGGADGLDVHRALAAGAAAFLHTGGRMMLEFGDGQAERLQGIFVEHNWIVESVRPDYNGQPRVLTVRRKF